jgi:hypothetical protein
VRPPRRARLVLLALGTLTFSQTRIWHDTLTFTAAQRELDAARARQRAGN